MDAIARASYYHHPARSLDAAALHPVLFDLGVFGLGQRRLRRVHRSYHRLGTPSVVWSTPARTHRHQLGLIDSRSIAARESTL